MAGGIDWFRWHHGSVTDPKFALVARRACVRLPDVLAVWAFILERASAADVRGYFGEVDAEAVDCLMGMDDGATARILIELDARGLTVAGSIVSWDKRQPKRERDDDTAAGRKRQQRAREAAESKSAPLHDTGNHVTPCHATSHQKTPRGEESREEKKEENTPPVDNSDPAPSAAGAVCVLLRSKRIATVNPGHPELKALLDAGTDVAAFDAAADIAIKADRPSFAYVLGIVKRQAEEAKRIAEEGLKAPAPTPRSASPPLTVPSMAAEATKRALEAENNRPVVRPPAEVLEKLKTVTNQIKASA